MKVLMVAHSYYPDDPRVRREAEALVERGIGVDIVCLRDDGERRFEIVNQPAGSPANRGSVRVHRLPVQRHRGSGFITYLAEYLMFFALAMVKVTGLFLHPFPRPDGVGTSMGAHHPSRPNAVQVHTIPDWLVFCSLVPRLFGCPVILDMHEVMPEFFGYRYSLSANHPVMRCIRLAEWVSTMFASRIITVSDPLKDILISRSVRPDKVTVVMNAADDKMFQMRNAECGMRSKIPINSEIRNPKSAFVMAYHGLLSDIYDLTVVFESLAELRKSIPGVRFMVLGRGPQESHYHAIVSRLGLDDVVTFYGYLPQAKVIDIIAEADVGVVPLAAVPLTDLAFPTKVVEYIALGIPVITAERRTVRHYFGPESICFYQADDPKSLQQAVLGLYQNPDKRQALVSAARQSYGKISWPVMRRRYLALIES